MSEPVKCIECSGAHEAITLTWGTGSVRVCPDTLTPRSIDAYDYRPVTKEERDALRVQRRLWKARARSAP